MKSKVIAITQADIDKGKRKSYCQCPLALAVRRALRLHKKRKVVVRHEGVFIGSLDEDTFWTADLGWEFHDFISAFDNGETVQPVSATLHFK